MKISFLQLENKMFDVQFSALFFVLLLISYIVDTTIYDLCFLYVNHRLLLRDGWNSWMML